MTSDKLPSSETYGAKLDRDADVWAQLVKTIGQNGHGSRYLLECWPSYVRRINLLRFLAHFKLFESIRDLPGSIVEVGVFRGQSFFTWAKLLEIFCPNDRHKFVYGFDSFEGLQDFDDKDGVLDDGFSKVKGGWSAADVRNEIFSLLDIHNADTMIPTCPRFSIIEGPIEDTLPHFIKEHPGLRIPLLHLDVDLYRPTKFAAEQLIPRVLKGGVVVLNQYGLEPWEGASKAVDEVLADLNIYPEIKRFDFSATPGGYFHV